MSKSILYLIGSRGTGKSTVGRILAQRIGWPFLDADEQLEGVAGRSIAAIFADEGEAGFRDREAAILAELSLLPNRVIATGGGVVLSAENREILRRTGFIVWLQSTAEAAFARLQADPSTASRRPNLTPAGGLEELRNLMAAREPLYRESSDFAIDTALLSPEAAAAAILSAWDGSIFRQSSGAPSSLFSA